ncbi:hypothetical protein Q5P01_004277 [Channa striata]|uniref:Uncharacterized protein n=1 Tax=Channa striata TaxID=64152 RepID=A0AA88NJ53_CHASR|nr:hypothetical protein Q5P01_004277 [Channa striata]
MILTSHHGTMSQRTTHTLPFQPLALRGVYVTPHDNSLENDAVICYKQAMFEKLPVLKVLSLKKNNVGGHGARSSLSHIFDLDQSLSNHTSPEEQ